MKLIKSTILFLVTIQSSAQVFIPGYDFFRSNLEDSTHLSFYASIDQSEGDFFSAIDPLIKLSYNSSYARGYNDGPIWKGKGVTTEAHFGIIGRKGIISYSVHPVVYFSQNQAFELAPNSSPDKSVFAYQFQIGGDVDFVQRYGNASFVKSHLGQSEVKLTLGHFITSVSTQNFSLGPAVLNPIVMSNHAAGFPHLRFGFEPFELKFGKRKVGDMEAYLIYGLLNESEYFDFDNLNDTRYFNGISLGYRPSFMPNLTVGFQRMLYKNTQLFESKDLISPVLILDQGVRGDSINTNDTFDQIAAISIAWKFPKAGFRTYLEFAKNDFGGDLRSTFLEIEHGRGFTIGFEKSYDVKSDWLINILFEHVTLARGLSQLWRGGSPFYSHGINRQGYTNDGQVLGAGIGPGSNANQLRVLLATKNEQFGTLLERVEFNKDFFVENIQDKRNHDVELNLGFFYRKSLDKIEFTSEFTLSHNFKRYYSSDATNFYFSLAARYRL